MTAAIDCFIDVTDSTEFFGRLTAQCNDIQIVRVAALKFGLGGAGQGPRIVRHDAFSYRDLGNM